MGLEKMPEKKIQKGAGEGQRDRVGIGRTHTVTELCQIKAPRVRGSKASPLPCLSPLGAPPPSLATLPAKCPRCETETLRGGPQGPVPAALCNLSRG